MRKHVFLATCLLALLFSCSTKKEQEEVVIQSLKHEVLMGDEYLIGKINDMALMNDSIPVVINVGSDKMFQVLDHSRKRFLKWEMWDKDRTISCCLSACLQKGKIPLQPTM